MMTRNAILLVDDNQINRLMLRNILQDEYTILEAENGKEAMECLRQQKEIAAVVLDLIMPVMDGFAVLKAIQKDVALVKIPVIVFSGCAGEDTESMALELGAVEFIPKPFNAQTIKQRIRNIVRLSQMSQDMDALRVSEERYRIAASAGGRITAYYDFQTGVYHQSNGALIVHSLPLVIENVPQSFFDRDIIARESVGACRAFFERIKNGEKTCVAHLSVRINERQYRWFRCEATVIFDLCRQPSQAVIVYTDVTDQQEKEAAYLKWQQSLQARSPKDYTLFRCNLSQDNSFEAVDGRLLQDHVKKSDLPFNLQSEAYAAEFVYPEDREQYLRTVRSEFLLASYHRNQRIQTLEYREILQGGLARWIRLMIELVEYPDSRDIGAYLMYENIDTEKREALKVREMAEHDPLTGALNRSALSARVDRIIQESKDNHHAFFMIDLDRFKQLNDHFGHAAGDQALMDFAKSLRLCLRSCDLIGRLGGDEFIVFMLNVPHDAVVAGKARQICEFARKNYSAEVHLSASIGIARFPEDGESFETLYHKADAALYDAKESGRDSFRFYNGQVQAKDDARLIAAPLHIGGNGKRRMLIADSHKQHRDKLEHLFQGEYAIETAEDADAVLARLRYFGTSISVVLLDLAAPDSGGFVILDQMRARAEMQAIPVIVICKPKDQETTLRAIRKGAADFAEQPIDPAMIRIRVEAAVSRAESERLRAQNNYLLLQNSEEAKFRTVLEATGTVVIAYDWMNGVYVYDSSIGKHLAGTYDNRRLWQILLSDMVADSMDVHAMQEMVHQIVRDSHRSDGEMTIRLKTPSGQKQWFRMRVFKQVNEYQLTSKLMITLNNVNEEVLASEKLHFQAERDELTGLWNRNTFFGKVAAAIAEEQPGFYVMTGFDISGFKVINDQFGSEKGDEVLRQVAEIFRDGFEAVGGIVCRITADRFAVLYPASFMYSEKIVEIRKAASVLDGSIPPVSFSIGRYIVDDLSLPVSSMYDRATLAQNSVKGRYDENIATYDETMRNRLLRQQELIGEMKPALENGQFEVWFQPQYNHVTGARIGAEALVRWRHPERGIVSPGDFIPAFERNGFIYELDQYVWETVCQYLRRWLDEGRNPLPVSVNISRYDMLRDDLCDVFLHLTEKYAIPIGLLRLEITESAFAKDTERIVSVVKELMSYGFTVEIDDFGSGYSSLNTLKDVPAQIMKMDMRFLKSSLCASDGSCRESASRGGNILESVVRMAKWLGMSVIAEGVETGAQADYLTSIGCNYLQGFLYAHPMSAEAYEQRTRLEDKEEKLLALETVEHYDNNRFWDPDSMDTLIFNTYVGCACIFEWSNGHMEILRANEKYAKTIGGENCSVEDVLKLDWFAHMDETSAATTRDAIEQTIASGDDAVSEVQCHDLFGNGKDTYLRNTFRVIARTTNRYLLYATHENLTAEREAERERMKAQQQLQELNENLQNMMNDMPGGFARLSVQPGNILATEYVNDNFCRIRGMTREEILADDSENAMGTIHPEDTQRVKTAMAEMLATGKTCRMQYRLRHKSGAYIPLTVFGRVSGTEAGAPVINAYYADMSEDEKNAMAAATILPIVLSTIMSSTTDLSFVKDRDSRYLSCSKPFAEMVGAINEAAVIGKKDDDLFDKQTAAVYHADDLRLLAGGESLIDYLEPIPSDDGLQHYSSTSKYILRDSTGEAIGLYGVGRDVTEVRTAFERLKLLTDSIPGGLATYALSSAGLRIVYFNDGLCKLFGCTREEYAAATKEKVITACFPEDIPLLQEQIRKMVSDGTPVNCTYRIRDRKTGGCKWINLRAAPAEKRDGIMQANAVFYDVTEQKQAEEAACVRDEKTGELLCKTLLREGYDYVARVDGKTGSFELLTSRDDRIGIPPAKGNDLAAVAEEWIGKNIHPDDREMMLEYTSVAGAEKKLADTGRYQVTFRLLQPDGTVSYKKLNVYYLDREREIMMITREGLPAPAASGEEKQKQE